MPVPLFPSWPACTGTAAVWAARSRADIRMLRSRAAAAELRGDLHEAQACRRLAGEIANRYGEPRLHRAEDAPALDFILNEARDYRRRARRTHADSEHEREEADYEVARSEADRIAFIAEGVREAMGRAA